MSKLPLDLAKFKRVSSTPSETTMQHADGHKLIINHAALDQKKLSALSALPLLSQENKLPEKRMAEGGDPGAAEAIEQSEPVEAPSPMEDEAPEASPVPSVPVTQVAPADVHGMDYQEPTTPADPEAAQAASATPSPQPQNAQQSNHDAWSTDTGQNLALINQEQAAMANDMAKGHITPKTYRDIIGDPKGPGKVLSILGLLLGGAGGGLTKTENPVTAMWDKQISNDLEAQKQNATNKQTLFNLNRERFPDLESATNFSRMQTNIGYLHNLAEDLNDPVKYPLGSPKRAQAEQALATVGQFVNTENFTLSGQIAAKQALMKSIEGGGGTGDETKYQANQRKMRMSGNPALAKIADANDERHIPGVPGAASVPIPQANKDEIQAMNVLDNKASDILQFAKAHKGTLSPAQKAIGAQKAEELINFYNNSIKGGVLTEGRLAWLDQQIKKNPTSIFQDILGNNARLGEIQSSNAQRKNILLKSLGFPVQAAPQQPGSQPPRPANGVKGQDGRMYVKSADGKYMVPVK